MVDSRAAVVEDRSQLEHLVARLNDPLTASALNSLLDNIELLAVLVDGLDGLARKGVVIGDTMADTLNEMRAAGKATGMDLRTTTSQLATLIPPLAAAAPAIELVLQSGIVEPRPVAVLSEAASALVAGLESAQAKNTRVGVTGLLRALRDEDVQRGLGFVIEMAKVFGRTMTRVELPDTPSTARSA